MIIKQWDTSSMGSVHPKLAINIHKSWFLGCRLYPTTSWLRSCPTKKMYLKKTLLNWRKKITQNFLWPSSIGGDSPWCMVRHHHWLGFLSPSPLKNDGVSSSIGMMKYSQYIWKVIKFHGSKPPTRSCFFAAEFHHCFTPPTCHQRSNGRNSPPSPPAMERSGRRFFSAYLRWYTAELSQQKASEISWPWFDLLLISDNLDLNSDLS